MSANAVNLRPTNQSAPNQRLGAANSVLATASDARKRPIYVSLGDQANEARLIHVFRAGLAGDIEAQRLVIGMFQTANIFQGRLA